jgi:uncharacterized protein YukE
MGFADKITKTVKTIETITKKISDIKEKYFSKIQELNDKLQALQDAINGAASGAVSNSTQYINTQIAKIQKEYDDIVKGLNDKIDKMVDDTNKLISKKIEGLKPIIAGELGSKVGLPPAAAEALASPIVDGLAGTFKLDIPEIKLPELNIPTVSLNVPEINIPDIPTNIPV